MTDDLTRRLEEIAAAAGNAAGDGDVGAARSRVQRRRRRRIGVATGVGVVVVTSAIVVPLALSGPADQDPAVTGGSWEACGQAVDTAAGAAYGGAPVHWDIGPVALRLDLPGDPRAAEAWIAGVVTHADGGGDDYAVVHADGAPLALWVVDDDGRVVGVGRPIGTYPEGLEVTPRVTAWTQVGFEVASCGDVAGTSRGDLLPSGEYEVVGGVGVAPDTSDEAGSAAAVVIASAELTMLPEEVPEVDASCGATWSEDAIASTDGYDLGIRLDGAADLGDAAPYDPQDSDPAGARFAVTATNTSGTGIAGSTGHPWIVVVRDGVVVGDPGGSTDEGLDATLAAGASAEYDAWVPLHDCTTVGVGEHADTTGGEPLPPGTYELYAVMDFHLTTPAGDDGPEKNRTDVTAVGGPWTVTVP
jgi:hypothetical protein